MTTIKPTMTTASEAFELANTPTTKLRGERSVPSAPARAAITIAHGKDEHQGRYAHVVAALVEAGYAVYTIDHRGHGKSDGERGVIERFDDYVDDFDLLVDLVRTELPGVPVVVLGHSMGGLIAARYTLRHQAKLAGLILSGAAIRVGDEVPAWQKKLLVLVGRFLPNRAMPPLEPGILSRDPEVDRAFGADPLCNNLPTRLGFVRELFVAAEETQQHLAEFTLPLLIMHGEADKLTSPLGSKALFSQAQSSDKTLKLWLKNRHEIFNDLDKDVVIGFMVDWLGERFSTKSPMKSVM